MNRKNIGYLITTTAKIGHQIRISVDTLTDKFLFDDNLFGKYCVNQLPMSDGTLMLQSVVFTELENMTNVKLSFSQLRDHTTEITGPCSHLPTIGQVQWWCKSTKENTGKFPIHRSNFLFSDEVLTFVGQNRKRKGKEFTYFPEFVFLKKTDCGFSYITIGKKGAFEYKFTSEKFKQLLNFIDYQESMRQNNQHEKDGHTKLGDIVNLSVDLNEPRQDNIEKSAEDLKTEKFLASINKTAGAKHRLKFTS